MSDMDDAVYALAALGTKSPRSATIRVYKNENVPLTRTNEAGEVEDAMFWVIDGDMHVHPERWDLFVASVGGLANG